MDKEMAIRKNVISSRIRYGKYQMTLRKDLFDLTTKPTFNTDYYELSLNMSIISMVLVVVEHSS